MKSAFLQTCVRTCLPLGAFLALTPIPGWAAQGGGFRQTARIDAASEYSELGKAVAVAGDVDGDGFDDVLVGAFRAAPQGVAYAGAAYVHSGFDGALIYAYLGGTQAARLGSSVAGAGDVNGDGFADFLVGAVTADPNGLASAGSVYLYSGLDGSLLFQFDGLAAGDNLGSAVAGVGDVNGDGLADVLLGANGAGAQNGGAALVYSGATGQLLFQFDGEQPGDDFGSAVASAGDFQGDGIPDLLIGAWAADPNGLLSAGSAYVYSGADGQLLAQFDGASQGDKLGIAVAGAGDVNGDGISDFLLGASDADPNGNPSAGSVYVRSGTSGALLYQLDGVKEWMLFGSEVAAAGDINGDGFDDFWVSAPWADPNNLANAGSVFLYSGASGQLWLRLDGEAVGDGLGNGLAGAANFNGDAYADWILGAAGADPGGLNTAGSAFLYAFEPFVEANPTSLSATQGGRIDFALDFPDGEAGHEYLMLASITGTGPWDLYGIEVPLTYDAVTQLMIQSPPPLVHQSSGNLDSTGDGLAWLDAMPGDLSAFAGGRFWVAAIAYEAGVAVHLSSVAVRIDILP
ncbi:MAG: hypothetical protein DWQ01_21825 [Planctomycetota bacterium]|nr:MAG: hypothetical protein DWQ01_21825 [Planctomycetota bacterium]